MNQPIKSGTLSEKKRATIKKLLFYLSTSIDAIKMTAYTIDGMLKNNKTNKEILDYLVGQSIAVTGTVFENTTGLYGYINGEYLDGALWVPDADFVPTQRPWYVAVKYLSVRLRYKCHRKYF